MGGRGSTATRNSDSITIQTPVQYKTKENAYGFEVEDSENPVVEFTNKHWKDMADLPHEAFADYDYEKLIKDKIFDMGDKIDDDIATLYSRLEVEDEVTSDEYHAGYHILGNWLGIKQPRYTVLDEGGNAWDERYGSVEQAEAWANEHSDTKYIYDTWTRKHRVIGGKNWKEKW